MRNPISEQDPYPPVTVVENLNSGMIRKFMDLHQMVVKNLKPGQAHFVRLRTRPDVRAHFRTGHAGVVSIVRHAMIGQLLLAQADGKELVNLDGYPLGSHGLKDEDTLIIQSVGVHPAWRKGDLAKRMLDAACAHAQKTGRGWVMGKTAENNEGGRAVFENSGFHQVGVIDCHGSDTYRSVFMAKAVPAQQTDHIPVARETPRIRTPRFAIAGA